MQLGLPPPAAGDRRSTAPDVPALPPTAPLPSVPASLRTPDFARLGGSSSEQLVMHAVAATKKTQDRRAMARD